MQAPGWQHGQDPDWISEPEEEDDVVGTILQIALPIVGLFLLVVIWKLERQRRQKVELEKRYKKSGTCTFSKFHSMFVCSNENKKYSGRRSRN